MIMVLRTLGVQCQLEPYSAGLIFLKRVPFFLRPKKFDQSKKVVPGKKGSEKESGAMMMVLGTLPTAAN